MTRPSALALAVALALWAGAAFAHPDPNARIAELTRRIAAPDAPATLWIQRGRLWLDEARYAEALADFDVARQRAAGEASAGASADYWAAEALIGLGRPDEALARVARFADAVGANPAASARAWRLRARAHAAADDRSAAARAWERYIASASAASPDDYLAWSRALRDDPAAALAALSAGTGRLGPIAGLERRAWAIEMEAGLYEAAAARAQRWIDARPDDVFLLRYLAEAHERAGRSAEAEAVWERVVGAAQRIRPTPALNALESDARRALADSPAN